MGHGRDRGAQREQFFEAEFFLLLRPEFTAMLFGDRRHQQHVGAFLVQLEPVMHALAQDRRREGPKTFAELDLQVHRFLHFRRTRIADDGAPAQRSRAEFHPSLKPSDDLVARDQVSDAVGDFVVIQFHEGRIL